eukprot:scaffold112302_cov67-Phaeocystis_antarctica.AAC.6
MGQEWERLALDPHALALLKGALLVRLAKEEAVRHRFVNGVARQPVRGKERLGHCTVKLGDPLSTQDLVHQQRYQSVR